MNDTEKFFKKGIDWNMYNYIRDKLTDYEDRGFTINISVCVFNGKTFNMIYDGVEFFKYNDFSKLTRCIFNAQNGLYYMIKVYYNNVIYNDCFDYILERIKSKLVKVEFNKHFLMVKAK